jgi:putative membrane protein
MTEPRRLHRAAIAVYSAAALRNFAFPLLVIIGVSLLGGRLDVDGLIRAAIYGGVGLAIALATGVARWMTTTYRVAGGVIDHRTGWLRVRHTHVPVGRIEALDTHQGPIQRLFGVESVDVQTGSAGKGGEIALPAVTRADMEALREAVAGAGGVTAARAVEAGGDAAAADGAGAARALEPERGPTRRLAGRDLAVAALTAGQLGVILPVLAGASQVAQQLGTPREGEQAAEQLVPHSVLAWVAAVLALVVVAWVLSALGALVAFAGFTVTRDGERLRIRRGLVQRSDASVTVHRVRAVRVVEGPFRRPFGLAALHVEVTGYAKEPAAARTLFPLVRLRDVRAFLDELLPELADDPRALTRPPRRAARRYLMWPVLAGLVVGAIAWLAGATAWPLTAALLGFAYGWIAWRGAGWRLRDGRLAMRRAALARTTILAPARYRESQTVSQSVWQRRAELASLHVEFGKRTTARIRHIEAGEARSVWESLA